MKNKIIISFSIFFNVFSLILAIISLNLPWYIISLKGKIDGQQYDTKVTFGLEKYSCSYLENDNTTIGEISNYYGVHYGSQCFPILPPTAGLFGLGIGQLILEFIIIIGLIPSFIGSILKIFMLPTKSKLKVRWVKALLMVFSIISIVLYIITLYYNSFIGKNLQLYNSDDQTSTSSDEFTKSLGDELWSKSFYGSSTHSDLVEDLNSYWKPLVSYYLLIISGLFILVSSILILFIDNLTNQEYRLIEE